MKGLAGIGIAESVPFNDGSGKAHPQALSGASPPAPYSTYNTLVQMRGAARYHCQEGVWGSKHTAREQRGLQALLSLHIKASRLSWSQAGQQKLRRQRKLVGWAWSHLCKVQGKGKESACCIPLLLPYLHAVTDA